MLMIVFSSDSCFQVNYNRFCVAKLEIKTIKVTRICDTVYHDEQAAFRCNIKQPGCENVCFNQFRMVYLSYALTCSESDRQMHVKAYVHIQEFCLKFIQNSDNASNSRFGGISNRTLCFEDIAIFYF